MTAPFRIHFTRLAMRVHRWSGLLGAAVFVLVGLSGAVLVFHEELDAALFPHVFEVRGDPRQTSYQRAAETAQRTYPGARLRGMSIPPPDSPRPVKVQVIGPEGGPTLIALVDATTGELRAKRIYGEGHIRFLEDPVSWLYQFHFHLTAGKAGQLVVVLASFLLVFSSLTGLFVYRKQLWRSLTLREPLRGRRWPALLSSVHRLVGTWTLLLNLLLAASGFWMLRATFTRAYWTQPAGRPKPTGAAPRSPHSFDEAIAAARRAVPGFEPSWLELRAVAPSPAREAVSHYVLRGRLEGESAFYGRYAASIVLDGRDLRVVQVGRPSQMSADQKVDVLAFPLHQGRWGGLPVRLLYVLAGLGVPLLSLSGTLIWLRRTRRLPQPGLQPAPAAAPRPSA